MADKLIAPDEATPLPTRNRLRERGMATVEYALGVIVVIVLIGAIVVAINTDTFQALLSGLFKALLGWITSAFQLPIPIKF